jgi:hypothetical protein
MNSAELMAQFRQGAASGPGDGAAPPHPHDGAQSDGDLRAAGVPSAGMSPWIWIAALLAIGLVVVGVYALVGGKLPP